MKRFLRPVLAAAVLSVLLAGCGGGQRKTEITAVSREDGSGTRGAFTQLFGITERNKAGEEIDRTTDYAEITNSTAVTLMTVAGNKNAVGYVSIGSLDDMVKTVSIDGAQPTAENIKNGSYSAARPFLTATKGEQSPAVREFMAFIQSAEGQKIIEETGYIGTEAAEPFAGGKASGKIVIAGSSSVAPVVEKLKEAFEAENPAVRIELQQNDSTTGMNALLEGTCDIGMASRMLKESELAQGIEPVVIARDGIAVVVHPENPVSELTGAQVRDIYTGALTNWKEIR